MFCDALKISNSQQSWQKVLVGAGWHPATQSLTAEAAIKPWGSHHPSKSGFAEELMLMLYHPLNSPKRTEQLSFSAVLCSLVPETSHELTFPPVISVHLGIIPLWMRMCWMHHFQPQPHQSSGNCAGRWPPPAVTHVTTFPSRDGCADLFGKPSYLFLFPTLKILCN